MRFCTSGLYLSPGCLSTLSGSIYKFAIRRLVFGSVVHGDVSLLGGARGGVRRVTSFFGFPGTSCFKAFFGGRANVSPRRCHGG